MGIMDTVHVPMKDRQGSSRELVWEPGRMKLSWWFDAHRTALLPPLPGVSNLRRSHINRGRKCTGGVLSGPQTKRRTVQQPYSVPMLEGWDNHALGTLS